MSDQPRASARSVLVWTAWFGVVSGLLELAVFLLKCHYLDPRNYNVGRPFPWMFPAAGVMVLGGPGLLLVLASRLKPVGSRPAVVLGVLAFFAYLGLLFRAPIYTAVCLLLAAGLAFRTARVLAPRLATFDRLAGRSLVVMVGLLAATAAASAARDAWAGRPAIAQQPVGAAGARNVILLVMDTVRAESLSLYGYPRDTTPNLRRLAARGVRFEHAYATAPWTAPSHASMFTGRWANELSVGWDRPLDRSHPTLAEFLAARGYATAGFVANTTYCSYETGLDRGFAHYEDYDLSPRAILLCSALVERTLNFAHKHPPLDRWLDLAEAPGAHRKSAARINADFLRWLDRNPGRPFFAFLNDFDAHHPYLPPEPQPAPFGLAPGSHADERMLRDWWDLDKGRLEGREVALARDAYDRCIASLDGQIGRLFDELDRRGLLDNTLVIITADHGEHLGEHRLFGHGCSLYLPELHVPLLLIAPGALPEGRTVDEPVSLRDLPATIVDRLNLRGPSPFPGRSLARTWTADPADRPTAEPLLSEIDAPPDADPNHGRSPVCRGPLKSLVDRDFHYIRHADGREELYDLARDPGEDRDLAASPESAPTLGRFRSALRRSSAAIAPGRKPVVTSG